MSAPKNLEDCYTEELADNWSANDQMLTMVGKLAEKASDQKLKDPAQQSCRRHKGPYVDAEGTAQGLR